MKTESTGFATAKEAYDWCIANKVVSQRVAEVLHALTLNSPMNQTMTHQAIIRSTGKVGLEKYSVSPRFAVLERMGLIREHGRLPCPVTKRTTVFYEATWQRPKMTEGEALKSGDKKELNTQLRRQVAELEKEVRDLRELLNLRSASFADRESRIAAAPVHVQESLFPA